MVKIIYRTVIIFAVLLATMRLLGKRQLGELELSELVVSIMAADAASVPLQDPGLSLWYGIVPCLTLFLCEYLLAWSMLKSIRLRLFVCGKPCFLVIKGVIQQKEMRKCRFTVDELAEELRKKDVNDISAVQYAVLETDGTLNVLLRPDQRPPTCRQLDLPPEDDGYATIVVEDGVLLRSNLEAAGRDNLWLQAQLRQHGCGDLRQVYALVVYESGKVFFAKREV